MRSPANALEAHPVHDAPPSLRPLPRERVPPLADAPSAARRRTPGTRTRLVAAFALLGAAVAAAFTAQLVRLTRMQRGMAELADHQAEMHLALQLEKAVREEYAWQARVLSREQPPDGASSERAVAALVAALEAKVDEPEAIALVRELASATRALEARFHSELAGEGASAAADDRERYRLVFEVEDTVDRLFALLREESVGQAQDMERLRRESVRLAVLFAAALPLFALAVGLYLSRAIARPLAIVEEAAARISRGDLAARIVPRGPPELAAIAAELNAMAAALAQHQERLLRSEKLAGLGRLSAGIAHEINNPLQVMLGYLSLHRGRVRGELGVHLARIEREAARCRDIVDGLLQLSRPATAVPTARVDLRSLADEVAEAVRLASPAAPAISVSGSAEALANAERLRQVLLNLVRNAAEAAGPSGWVAVEVGAGSGLACVRVSDSGPGIATELRERVFEPFFTTKASGTGLGLALARAMAQALGGDVELESPDGNGGARFKLTAPRFAEEDAA